MSKIRITLAKSKIGQTKHQKLVLEALGLGKIGSKTEQNLTPQISGMIEKVKHLVQIEEIK
ncbi:MAG: 50S ribosomal protein L30 [Bacteroidetes bacterium ADurb.Bin217]|nr:MAG: 50S ribosomal protein L30 [Bacteroidetes bacterium ADurb.Bin217]